MQKKYVLFQTLNEAHCHLLRINAALRSAFVETHKWQEFHKNGILWIDGEIAVVSEMSKHLYDYRTGFNGFIGKPVCRIGIWTKYFDNGQLAWQLYYGNGTHDYKSNKTFPSFKKDGTPIIRH